MLVWSSENGKHICQKHFGISPFSIKTVHLINRIPSRTIKNKSPYQLLYSKPLTLVHLKVFGCLAYGSTLVSHRSKFSPRARKSIFLGYKEGTKGYILYDLDTEEVFVSRNVSFYENHFPLKPEIVKLSSTVPHNVLSNSHLVENEDSLMIQSSNSSQPSVDCELYSDISQTDTQ